MTSGPTRRWTFVLAIILLAAASRLMYCVIHDDYYDDAYITFRYAENIVAGNGFVFNPAEPVYGSSSPLYTILISGLRIVVGREVLPSAARLAGILSLIGCSLLMYRSLPLGPTGRYAMLMLLLSYPRIFYSSIGGMEECFILLLMALSVYAMSRDSCVLLGISVGLLLVTKIDTVIWVPCLALVVVLRRRQSFWRTAAVGLGVSLPWIIYSLLRFGTLVPHTVYAKQVAYSHEPIFRFVDMFLLAVPDGLRGEPVFVVIIAAAWYSVIFLALWTILRRKDWLYLAFPLYCVAYTCALFLSGTSIGLWTRWTVPLWGCLIISTGYVVHEFSSSIERVFASRPSWQTQTGALVLYALLLAIPFVYPNRSALTLYSHAAVADWLERRPERGNSIMLEPIGLIGYRSGMYVHDFIGLVSPEVTEARLNAGQSNRWFARYLTAHHPTYVLLRLDEVRTNQFYVGGYGDSIFVTREKTWFKSAYDSVFATSIGLPVDRFILFKERAEPENHAGNRLDSQHTDSYHNCDDIMAGRN